MRKQIQVSVTDPCHQDWNAMHPSNGGRYCDQCEKTVIDFTGKSDAEIYRLLAKNKDRVCGRFTDFQLDRPITEPVSEKRKTLIAVFFSTVLAFTTNWVQGQRTKGKVSVKTESLKAIAALPDTVNTNESVTLGMLAMPERQIMIVTTEGKPISGAVLYIKGSLQPKTSNDAGYIAVYEYLKSDSAYVSMIGYESQEVKLNNGLTKITLKEKLNELEPVKIESALRGRTGYITLGGVSSVRGKRISQQKTASVSKPNSIDPFQLEVFPNPVRPGGILQIKLAVGNYLIQLLTPDGKLLVQERALISKGLFETLQIPSASAAGNVFLSVTNTKTGKKAVKTLLIVR